MKIKNLFFLASAFSISLSAVAQPSLNESNFAPTIGENVNYYLIDNFSGNEGPSGANQNWDFSDIANATELQVNYISCAASPDCAGNPGSTVVMKESNGAYVYYIVENNKMSIKGLSVESQGQNIAFHYSNPEEMMHFPFTFNDTYSDFFKSTGTLSMFNVLRSGTTTVTADAYGTLKTPNGIYSNVLRVYRHQVYTDTMSFAGSSQVIGYDTKIYTWYQPDNHDMILSISAISLDGADPNTALQYSDKTPTAIYDVDKVKSNFEVYPNPASRTVNIKLVQANDAIQNINVVNVLGQKVATYSANGLTQRQLGMYSFDLNAIPTGIYWLQVQTKQGHYSQKLQVVK